MFLTVKGSISIKKRPRIFEKFQRQDTEAIFPSKGLEPLDLPSMAFLDDGIRMFACVTEVLDQQECQHHTVQLGIGGTNSQSQGENFTAYLS